MPDGSAGRPLLYDWIVVLVRVTASFNFLRHMFSSCETTGVIEEGQKGEVEPSQ